MSITKPDSAADEQDLITIRSFGSESEALIAKSVLQAFAVDCTISSDDCGGQRLHLAITEGIRLLVRAEDVASAEQVLSAQTLLPESHLPQTHLAQTRDDENN